MKALLAHGADPNFMMPAPTFSLAFVLNSFRHRLLDKANSQAGGGDGGGGFSPFGDDPGLDSDDDGADFGDDTDYTGGSLSDAVGKCRFLFFSKRSSSPPVPTW
jgi:hypothetical protein